MVRSTDAGIFLTTSIALFSTGHWIGGIISSIMTVLSIAGRE